MNFDPITNPWDVGGEMYASNALQSTPAQSWQQGNQYWQPKSKAELQKEGLLQLAVLAAVLVAPAVAGAIGGGAAAGAAGTGSAGAATSAQAAGGAIVQGAGAAAGGIAAGISKTLAAISPFMQSDAYDSISRMIGGGTVLMNNFFHQTAPVPSDTLPSLRQPTSSPHPAYQLLQSVMNRLVQRPELRRKLTQARDKGQLPSVKDRIELENELLDRALDLLPNNIWESVVNTALQIPVSEAPTATRWSFSLTERQKRQLKATILSEGARGQYEMILWAYLNMIERSGFEQALSRSVAYKFEGTAYKFWLTYAGDPEFEGEAPPPRWTGISDFPTNRLAVDSRHPYTEGSFSELDATFDAQLTNRSQNPIDGWIGQGNQDDFNGGGKWARARRYLWLQENEEVTDVRVIVLPGYNELTTTVLFDEIFIEDFFRKNPQFYAEPVPIYPFN